LNRIPKIIQGGMGVAVSSWKLARAVAGAGQVGVVSGTAMDVVLARRLQLGDPTGEIRNALAQFPYPEVVTRVLADYYVPGGKSPEKPFKPIPIYSPEPPRRLSDLTVLANFTEVHLAKQGHNGIVGINLLEKIQLPTLPSLFGAMLAGVDYVLMGAGIPRAIPEVLDRFSEGKAGRLKIDAERAAPDADFTCTFDPADFCGGAPPVLKRPKFVAVISSATLALTLARKSSGRVDGFVVEGPRAGGHNAPPRGAMQLDENGEPIYGERDVPDLDKIRGIGLPFWLAGSYGRQGKLAEALREGAAGIQVGTPFAFCQESGLDPVWKARILEKCRERAVRVVTDPRASPTGFPFKVVQLNGTMSDRSGPPRERVCDLGYLRHAYQKEDGTLGFRCPGQPVESYVQLGGLEADTVGRLCVCNGLLAAIGLGQKRSGRADELPLFTAGDDLSEIGAFFPAGADHYTAADVLEKLLS
jgi:nitronate monooxygenase